MAEYIEREKLLAEMKVSGKAAYMVVQEAPAADVVEVVRCRDCKHENVHHAISDKCTWCDYWGIDPDFDDFCSYGEKRDNNATD